MKIAFVIGLYPFQVGGAEMQSLEIADFLSQLGHEITFISYSEKKYSSEKYEAIQIDTRPSWDYLHLTTKRRLFKVLDCVAPDMVYHRAFVPYTCYIAEWCRKNSIPFYFHIADIYTLIKKNRNIKDIISNKRLAYTLENADGIICQNEEQEMALKKFNLNRLKKIYNIHKINESPISDNRKQIVWIGKFIPAKNPALYVKLADVINKENDVIFTMFSSKCIDSEENNRLKDKISKRKYIRLLEGKDNKYINDYLCKNAAVLVNTSDSEGISNTFIQAWMRAIPVLSLNSNPDDWFRQNEVGYYCDGDVHKLETGLHILLKKVEDEQYRQNLIRFANEKFSPQVIIPQLTDFMKLKNT